MSYNIDGKGRKYLITYINIVDAAVKVGAI